jgi:hypothetical protein
LERGIDGQEHRPRASAHDRARGEFIPSNSCLLYFSSIDYITVMVARSVRDWRGVSMGRNIGRGPPPTTEQEESLSLLILVCFISHPLIT